MTFIIKYSDDRHPSKCSFVSKRKNIHIRASRLRLAAAFRLRRAAMHRIEWRSPWDSVWETVLLISIGLSSLGFVSLFVPA